MARGTESKSVITKKILETFEGSFLYNDGKEIRIPLKEDGEIVQIKVTLTCAKTNVDAIDSTPVEFKTTPAANASNELNFEDNSVSSAPNPDEIKISAEERANIARLVEKFNIR